MHQRKPANTAMVLWRKRSSGRAIPIPDTLTPNVALHGISARLIAVAKWRSPSVVPLPIPAANLVGHAERIASDLFLGGEGATARRQCGSSWMRKCGQLTAFS